MTTYLDMWERIQYLQNPGVHGWIDSITPTTGEIIDFQDVKVIDHDLRDALIGWGKYLQSMANPHKGKRVAVTMNASIIGPCLHYKTHKVIGYHVKIYMGRNRKDIMTMIPIDKMGPIPGT